MKYLKTLSFFIITLLLILWVSWAKQSEKYEDAFEVYRGESENARGIYTGKIRDVYNPIDKAFVISDELKRLKKNKVDISRYKHLPVISLWGDPEDLHDEDRGIIVNGFKKGRLWERAAFMRYYKNGQNTFESIVGLRQHGRGSRKKYVKKKNFRIYFRDKYGEKSFKLEPHISFKEGSPIKRMVLRKEHGIYFRNDYTSFLLHKLGGLGPKFEHAALMINGELHGVYTMTAHLTFNQLKLSVGHENFVLAKIYGEMTTRDLILYEKLRSILEKYPDINYDFVDDKVSMDSAIADVLVVMYSGNGDWSQGMYFKDLEGKNKWKYISWDFDTTFSKNGYNSSNGATNAFNTRSVDLVTKKKKGKVLWSIFNRLIYKDQKFRKYFSDKVNELFTILESAEHEEVLKRYELIASEISDVEAKNNIQLFRDYKIKRKSILCKDLKEFVNLTPETCIEN